MVNQDPGWGSVTIGEGLRHPNDPTEWPLAVVTIISYCIWRRYLLWWKINYVILKKKEELHKVQIEWEGFEWRTISQWRYKLLQELLHVIVCLEDQVGRKRLAARSNHKNFSQNLLLKTVTAEWKYIFFNNIPPFAMEKGASGCLTSIKILAKLGMEILDRT